MCEEVGVRIVYQARFEGIVKEDDEGVVFLINGREHKTSLLIGADGIFSTVRRYLAPSIQPEYTGVIGAMAHIRTSSVKWPYPDYEPQFTMQGKAGVFITMPEDPFADEIMVAVQTSRPESTRDEWERLNANKERICEEFFRRNYGLWHETGKQIIDQVCAAKESIFLWPFLKMPKLERWYSQLGKVILIGDAAHAVPPSSGQGVNQALEDVYSLTLVLTQRLLGQKALAALERWQKMRQARIDAVYDWTANSNNVQRMPEDEKKTLIAEGKIKDPGTSGDDMRWLYQYDIDEAIKEIIA